MFKIFKAINSCDGAYSSLDVRFTKACDNRCAFCVEKGGLHSLEMADPKTLADATIQTGIKDVLVLGGEPLINLSRLLEYLKLIRGHVKSIYITTSLPNTVDITNKKFLEIFSLIDGLNVSVHSVDSGENNKIFNATYNHNRIKLLKSLLSIDVSHKIRVNINLVKQYDMVGGKRVKFGINSKEKLIKSLKILEDMGCTYVKINELQHSPGTYVSYEDIMGAELKSPYANGCQQEVEIEGIDSSKIKLVLKRSCFLVENSRKASIIDLLKTMYIYVWNPKTKNIFSVLYEDGSVQNCWLQEKG